MKKGRRGRKIVMIHLDKGQLRQLQMIELEMLIEVDRTAKSVELNITLLRELY